MQLSEIRQRLSDLYGSSRSEDDAFLNRCINDAYRKLCHFGNWWWLQDATGLTFQAPYTALSGTVTSGANTIVFASAFTAYTAYSSAWVYFGNRLNRISSWADNQHATLTDTYLGTTGTAMVNIWDDKINLGTAYQDIISLFPTYWNWSKPLRRVGVEEIESYGPAVFNLAYKTAQAYAVWWDDDSLWVRIFPPPKTSVVYRAIVTKQPTPLSADNDVPEMPERYQMVLVDLARAELCKASGQNPDEVAYWEGEARKSLVALMSENSQRRRTAQQMGRWGIRGVEKRIGWRFINTGTASG